MRRIVATIFIIIFLGSSFAFAREVELSWEPFTDALGYHVIIARNPSFKDVVAKKAIKTPTLTLSLDIGTYFYKVRAVDKDKQPGHWSEPMKFEVTPYPPELKFPKSESEYSFYEIPPKIDFEWKPVDDNPEYEIFIYKTTGKKAFEKRVKDTKFSVDSLHEGEYMWKMRTVYKGIYESPYGEPRRFTIEKKDLKKPELVKPDDNAQLPAYKGFSLDWKKDPVTHFTDVSLSYVDDETGKTSKIPIPENLNDSESTSVNFAEPGEYTWSVRTKEGEKTPGIASDQKKFRVRKDLISDDNSHFYYAIGYSKRTNDYRTTKLGGNDKGSVSSSAFINQAGASYFFNSGYGLQFDFSGGTFSEDTHNLPENSISVTNRLRMGKPGFNQQFYFGFRQMNTYEIITQTKNYQLYSASGFVVGQQLNGSLGRSLKMTIDLQYFKPGYNDEDNGKFQGDVYEGGLYFGWNVAYKFWVGYEFRYQKGIFMGVGKDAPDTFNTKWETTDIQPLLIRFSYEN